MSELRTLEHGAALAEELLGPLFPERFTPEGVHAWRAYVRTPGEATLYGSIALTNESLVTLPSSKLRTAISLEMQGLAQDFDKDAEVGDHPLAVQASLHQFADQLRNLSARITEQSSVAEPAVGSTEEDDRA